MHKAVRYYDARFNHWLRQAKRLPAEAPEETRNAYIGAAERYLRDAVSVADRMGPYLHARQSSTVVSGDQDNPVRVAVYVEAKALRGLVRGTQGKVIDVDHVPRGTLIEGAEGIKGSVVEQGGSHQAQGAMHVGRGALSTPEGKKGPKGPGSQGDLPSGGPSAGQGGAQNEDLCGDAPSSPRQVPTSEPSAMFHVEQSAHGAQIPADLVPSPEPSVLDTFALSLADRIRLQKRGGRPPDHPRDEGLDEGTLDAGDDGIPAELIADGEQIDDPDAPPDFDEARVLGNDVVSAHGAKIFDDKPPKSVANTPGAKKLEAVKKISKRNSEEAKAKAKASRGKIMPTQPRGKK
jgi:hypothetical protein